MNKILNQLILNYKVVRVYISIFIEVILSILTLISILVLPFLYYKFILIFLGVGLLSYNLVYNRKLQVFTLHILTLLLLGFGIIPNEMVLLGVSFGFVLMTFVAQRRFEIIAIYGAGKAGLEAFEILGTEFFSRVVFFIDDDLSKKNRWINVTPILCSKDELISLKLHKYIDTIVVAIPSQETWDITDLMSLKKVQIKTLPSFELNKFDRVKDLVFQDITFEKLLRKNVSNINEARNREIYQNKTILITGGGGSIGSQLVLELIKYYPAKIIVLENSEVALYTILKKLDVINEENSIEVVGVLGSYGDSLLLNKLDFRHEPNIIFHAGAYKHVPIVESNFESAFINNVASTRIMLEQLANFTKLERLVLVSSDKAVNPTNLMGLTKRMCELLFVGFSSKSNVTTNIVRFGNVFNSSGSVIPLFKEQIRRGGPITITHKDITRYFMSIPEAASLVISSGSTNKNQATFVLDMGKPYNIKNLAVKLAASMGHETYDEYSLKNNDSAIEIIYTGLRPGEKLYEELFHENSDLIKLEEGIFMQKFHFDGLDNALSVILAVEYDIRDSNFDLINYLNQLSELPFKYMPKR